LSKLQDQATGFPGRIARTIIEEELGAPLETFFDYFDEHPFAAASIGQIHRAHLRREDSWVAVKVQRPSIASSFRRDLSLINWIVRFFNIFSILRFLRWQEGLLELRNIMEEELDYRYEAMAMRRMKKTLRKHGIYVPKVFSEYTRRRVLVTEFIHAALMADFIKMYAKDPVRLSAWLAENNIDPQLVSRRLVFSLFRQLFEDNFFHGDLHPGNILLLRNSQIVFIDLGTIGFTEAEFLQRMQLFTQALVTRDYSKAADLAMLLAANIPPIDLEALKRKLVRMMRTWSTRTLVRDLPYHEKSLDRALVDVSKLMMAHRISMDWAFLRIRRALTTLDSALIYLFPNANYTKLFAQYFRAAERRALRNSVEKQLARRVIKGTLSTLDLQAVAQEHVLYQGSILRRQAQVFQSTTGKFSYFFSILCGQIALVEMAAGVLFLLAFLHQHHTALVRPIMGRQLRVLVALFPPLDYQVWILLIVLVAYLCRVALRLRKKFSEVEVQQGERR